MDSYWTFYRIYAEKNGVVCGALRGLAAYLITYPARYALWRASQGLD